MTLRLTTSLSWDADDDEDETGFSWDFTVPEPRLALEGEDPADYDEVILVEKRVIHRWGQQCCLLYYSDGHMEKWFWRHCPRYSYRVGYHISYRIRHPEGWLGTAQEEYFIPDWNTDWGFEDFDPSWPCFGR